MSDQQTIKPGSRVRLHARMILDNGYIVEDTTKSEVLDIVLGKGDLEPNLEKVLVGLTEGSRHDFHFAAGEVFGMPDDSNIQQIPREQFSGLDESKLNKGAVIGFDTPNGEQIPGMILDTDKEMITVDFNHPLAGKAFTFKVEIVSVEG